MGDILGYARVSTGDQDVAGQTMRLEKAGAIKIFTDVISGKGSVAKIVKLEHAWRRLDGRNDDGFQVAPFPG